LRATVNGGSAIFLSWTDASSNEEGFRLESGTSAVGPWDRVWIFPANSSSFFYSDVPVEQSCYRIFAYNAQGDSAPSNIACATTMADPSSLTATVIGQQAIELGWKDNSSLEDGYEVNRSIPPMGPWNVVAQLPANSTTYRDTDIVPDVSYVYYVRARRGSTFSDWSNLVRATAASKPPEAPTVSVTPYGSGAAWVAGSLPQGADQQRFERSTDDGTTWSAVCTPSEQDCSSILDAGLTPEQRVCYRAFALNSIGESPPSSMACTIPPAAPCDVNATASPGGTVTLTWTDCSAIETGYEVSRMLSFQEDWWMTALLPPGTTTVSDWPGGSDVYAIYQLVTISSDGRSDPVILWVYVPP
jgi:titin